MFTRFLDKSPTNGGYVFISQRFGNDITGDGTKEQPVKTAQRADVLGSSFIFDIGIYDVGGTNGIFYGENRKYTIITAQTPVSTIFCDNITILNMQNSIGRLYIALTFTNCNILFSTLWGLNGDTRSRYTVRNCLLHSVDFRGNYGEYIGNVFSNCIGAIANDDRLQSLIFNNYFFDNNSSLRWTWQNSGGRNDYNVFESGTMTFLDETNTPKTVDDFQIDFPTENQNGFIEANPYISYDKNFGQNQFYEQIPFLTQGTQCSLIGFGLPHKFFIGPYWIGSETPLVSLIATLVLTNVVNNSGEFELIDDTINGTINQPTAVQISVNDVVANNFDVIQFIDYNVDGSYFRYLNIENPYEIFDSLENQSDKTTIKLATGKTEAECNSATLKEYNLAIGLLIDDTGKTSGELGFNLSSSILIDSFKWIKFEIQIRVV